MTQFKNPHVRGEPVAILGPKPSDWRGLGQTYEPAILVRYPDGEVGAVRESMIREGEE